MRQTRWLAGIAVLAVAAWVGWINTFGRADDKVAADKIAADKVAAKKVDANKVAFAAPDNAAADTSDHQAAADEPLTVPKGSAEDLLAFIEKVRAIKPPAGEDEIKSFVIRTRGPMLEAANKILADKPEGKTSVWPPFMPSRAALFGLANYTDDAQAEKQLRGNGR